MLTLLAQTSDLASAVLFYVFAVVAGGAAVGVVVTRNIVRAAVGLLFALIGTAGLYVLLAAEFLAAVQLVVYVGGTLVLIIFGVMLTSKSPFIRFEPKPAEVAVAVAAGTVLLIALVLALVNWTVPPPPAAPDADRPYPLVELAQALLGDYLVPFEVVSVLLLCVMIGAAYLAKARNRGDRARGSGDCTVGSGH